MTPIRSKLETHAVLQDVFSRLNQVLAGPTGDSSAVWHASSFKAQTSLILNSDVRPTGEQGKLSRAVYYDFGLHSIVARRLFKFPGLGTLIVETKNCQRAHPVSPSAKAVISHWRWLRFVSKARLSATFRPDEWDRRVVRLHYYWHVRSTLGSMHLTRRKY